MSFNTFHQGSCPCSTDKVKSSIVGGNMRANAHAANAPMREIRRSRCGTIAAIPKDTKLKLFCIYILNISEVF